MLTLLMRHCLHQANYGLAALFITCSPCALQDEPRSSLLGGGAPGGAAGAARGPSGQLSCIRQCGTEAAPAAGAKLLPKPTGGSSKCSAVAPVAASGAYVLGIFACAASTKQC